MKKIVLIVCLIVLLSGINVFAQETPIITSTSSSTTVSSEVSETSATLDLSTLIAKLPCLNQAILYSWDSNAVKYAMSFTIISFFDSTLKIDCMYVPSTEVGVLASIKLLDVGKWIQFPILKYIELEPFVYYGIKKLGSGEGIGESDYGAGIKIISIKF